MTGGRGALAAGALVSALVTVSAGCSSSHHNAGPATTTSTSSPSSSSSSSPGGPQTFPTEPATTAPASTSSSAPAGPSRCATGELTASLTNPNGAAGSVYYSLRLTNHGTASCILQGYAGVSFVTGPDGQQVGAPASRGTVAPAPTITLAPGSSAGAVLQITDPTNYGTACGLTPVAGLRVYPPNQTASLFIAHADRACANTADVTLHVAAFQPAA